MKIAFAVVLTAFLSLITFAQNGTIESNFEKNKSKYKFERLTMGEDATSGYDYLVYKNKDQIVKYRSIWSGAKGTTPRIEDYYYNDGTLILLVKATIPQKLFKTAVKGRAVQLQVEEKFFFTKDKMTDWIEKGKQIPATDARWKDKEKEVLGLSEDEMSNYKFLKEN